MQRFRWTVWTLGLWLSVGVAWPAATQDVQAEAPVFTEGDWFQRSFGDDKANYSFIAIVEVNKSGIRMEETSTGRVLFADPQFNLYREEWRADELHYEPSLVRYSFPLSVGKVWKGSYTVRSELAGGDTGGPDEVAYRCEVDCIERVAVPAGEFDAFKTVCEYTQLEDRDQERESFWFAPTAGVPVKQIWEERHPAYGWRVRAEATLAEYKHAHTVEFSVLAEAAESICDIPVPLNESPP